MLTIWTTAIMAVMIIMALHLTGAGLSAGRANHETKWGMNCLLMQPARFAKQVVLIMKKAWADRDVSGRVQPFLCGQRIIGI
jgi:hypothetical protein